MKNRHRISFRLPGRRSGLDVALKNEEEAASDERFAPSGRPSEGAAWLWPLLTVTLDCTLTRQQSRTDGRGGRRSATACAHAIGVNCSVYSVRSHDGSGSTCPPAVSSGSASASSTASMQQPASSSPRPHVGQHAMHRLAPPLAREARCRDRRHRLIQNRSRRLHDSKWRLHQAMADGDAERLGSRACGGARRAARGTKLPRVSPEFDALRVRSKRFGRTGEIFCASCNDATSSATRSCSNLKVWDKSGMDQGWWPEVSPFWLGTPNHPNHTPSVGHSVQVHLPPPSTP